MEAAAVVTEPETLVCAGQQELVAPPARRLFCGDRTDGCWFGIDPSTKRMSLAVVTADGSRHVDTRSFPLKRDGARLAVIYEEAFDFANEMRSRYGTPGFCWIEQPFGQNVPPVSQMVVGVISAAVWRLLSRVAGRDVPVETVPPPTWKKLALGAGFGGAKKPVVMRWARDNGYGGILEDEADALGIAVAASRLVAFRP